MALTIGTKLPVHPTGYKIVSVQVTLDSSYPTGGEAVTPDLFGLSDIMAIHATSRGGYVVTWNGSVSAPKLMAFRQTAATSALIEVPNTTDLSAVVADVIVIGR